MHVSRCLIINLPCAFPAELKGLMPEDHAEQDLSPAFKFGRSPTILTSTLLTGTLNFKQSLSIYSIHV